MKARDEVLETIRTHRGELSGLGVAKLALFGSVARGEVTATSDIDLLVEFDRPVGLFHFVRVKRFLEHALDRPVDLVTPDALHPALRSRVLREAVDAA